MSGSILILTQMRYNNVSFSIIKWWPGELFYNVQLHPSVTWFTSLMWTADNWINGTTTLYISSGDSIQCIAKYRSNRYWQLRDVATQDLSYFEFCTTSYIMSSTWNNIDITELLTPTGQFVNTSTVVVPWHTQVDFVCTNQSPAWHEIVCMGPSYVLFFPQGFLEFS